MSEYSEIATTSTAAQDAAFEFLEGTKFEYASPGLLRVRKTWQGNVLESRIWETVEGVGVLETSTDAEGTKTSQLKNGTQAVGYMRLSRTSGGGRARQRTEGRCCRRRGWRGLRAKSKRKTQSKENTK